MNDLLQSQSYALIADLGKLAAGLPVDGSLIFLGRQVIEHSLSWSDEKAARLARVVDALCSPLLQAGRDLQSLILEYEDGALLLVTRDSLRLAVVMRGVVDRPDDLIAKARGLLQTHAEYIVTERGIQGPPKARAGVAIPRPTAATTRMSISTAATDAPTTEPVEDPAAVESKSSPEVPASLVMELAIARLAMVMGRKAAADLVARESAKSGLQPDSLLDADRGRELIARIFSHVPHKAKRESLTFECQSLFLESFS